MSMNPNNAGSDFLSLLGAGAAKSIAGKGADDRPKAQVWANIGYLVTVKDEQGEPTRKFINVPGGIPLDNVTAVPTNGKPEWANQQRARNALTEHLVKHGMGLDPGTAVYFPQDTPDGVLVIEVRRVGEANTASADSENPYLLQF